MTIYKEQYGHYTANTKILILATAILSPILFSASAIAAADADKCQSLHKSHEDADCVFEWGAWEMDIEPAASGINSSGNHPIKANGSQFTLTANGTSSIAPKLKPVAVIEPTIPAPPAATPNIPVTPPPAPNVGASSGTSSISGTGGLNLGF